MKKAFFIFMVLIFPLFVLAQDNVKKKAYFFYLDTCSHCHNVDNYFSANGIYDKYDIKKLDASIPANSQLLMKLYAANNFPEDQRGGVPVVAFGDKFLVGDTPTIGNFVTEIDASDAAYALPNPDDSGGEPNIVVHEGPLSSASAVSDSPSAKSATSTGKKKSYVPVIIAAIIVLGAGALIFMNREK